MCQPFIRNHQYNLIKKQAGILQNALRTVADPKVLESVRYSTEAAILEQFPGATAEQKQKLDAISKLDTIDDFLMYMKSLEPFMTEFPHVTEKQILKLFPKNKKLKLPDLSAIDYRFVTYLGWVDISTNKLFIIYHADGQFVGMEGRFTPTNKKGLCFICNRFEETALFSAISRTRPANASPDYYKAVGNYMCIDSHACNKNITDPASLEKFISAVNG